MELLPLVLLAILLGGLSQGAAGIGFGLVSMAILPVVLEVRVAVPVVAGLAWLACAVVWIRWRRHTDLGETLPLLVGEALGSPLGVLGLVRLDPRWVKAGLGALLLAYGLRALAGPRAGKAVARPPVARRWGVPAGFVAGVLGSAFNTGGPPLIVYATARGWAPGAFRANLQLVFLFNTTIQLAMLRAHGLWTEDAVRLQLATLPALLVGLGAGTWLGRRMDAAAFRRLVFSLLTAFGALYLFGAFFP